MTYNPNFGALQQYPFEKLRRLNADVTPDQQLHHIPLSLGEPKHPPPRFVIDALSDQSALQQQLASYPATKGSEPLRQAIAAWLRKRFEATLDAETQILPVSGTREALFSFAQAMLSGAPGSRVVMPNPFYQIYEGAALLAGATPYFVNNEQSLDYQQNFSQVPDEIWQNTELLYLCSPGNPTGHIMSMAQQQALIELAHKYDFLIAADECYSELYFDSASPPASLLSASNAMGNPEYARCVVFHSLSKRSNLPGLRSGFVAGHSELIQQYLQYRTYHGCALPPHHQHASTLAWQDEDHVAENRALYREKFIAVSEILAPHYDLHQPEGGFYHWLPTPINDQLFCTQLLAKQNVTVMPGSFLGRDSNDGNPGYRHVRVAWVAPLQDCIEAAQRLKAFAVQISS
jgi:N-succinyldiaminopimelate aminotransferase